MDALTITRADVRAPDIHNLLMTHHALMRSSSPEESCHVMAPGTLLDRGVTLFAARDGDTVLGVGALAVIAPGHGELKSMHTAAEARGRGVARAVLGALIGAAQEQGLTRLSLETGSMPEFAAARALYETEGFDLCPPFGDYVEDPLSVFMTRTL